MAVIFKRVKFAGLHADYMMRKRGLSAHFNFINITRTRASAESYCTNDNRSEEVRGNWLLLFAA